MTQPRLLGERYELETVVGRGGMAEVYRAHDIRLERVVAIKTLRADLARDQTFQARFRREAQSAASLNHPSIVAVYDTGEDMADGVPVPYIVMEYVEGRTVRDLIIDGRPLPPENALEITDGLLGALEYSHESGIVHRDIKPGNVMVTRNGDIKVMDFGIARAMSDAQATMTQTAQVIGTAPYLSPEQARGERVDTRSDLYSTGCLFYELLTGRPPFTGDSPVAIAYQHVRENPVPPTQVNPEIPEWADAIVLKAMAKDPAERYQTAGEMRMDVRRALSGMPVAAPASTEMYAATRRMGASATQEPRAGTLPPYDYADGEADGGEGPPRGGGRALGWIAGILIILGAIAALAYFMFGGGAKTYAVPQVQGQPVAQAKQEIITAHLKPIVSYQASSSVANGDVISTSPQWGNKEPAGTAITLYASTGPKLISVPDVVGQSQANATQNLSSAGLNVQEKADNASTAPQGTVTKQQPGAGKHIAPGSTVTIYVSGGGTAVPSVINDPVSTAQQILQSDGFKANVKTVPGPASATPGDVFNQTPNANTTKPQGSTVTIYVAKAAPSPSPKPAGGNPSPGPAGGSPSPGPAGGSPSSLPGLPIGGNGGGGH